MDVCAYVYTECDCALCRPGQGVGWARVSCLYIVRTYELEHEQSSHDSSQVYIHVTQNTTNKAKILYTIQGLCRHVFRLTASPSCYMIQQFGICTYSLLHFFMHVGNPYIPPLVYLSHLPFSLIQTASNPSTYVFIILTHSFPFSTLISTL